MASKFLIYGLLDPHTGILRYIGKSCSGMNRPQDHSRNSTIKRTRSHTRNWCKQLKNLGLRPIIEILEELTSKDGLAEAERYWIASVKATGAVLLNHTDGGEGAPGRIKSIEEREKLRQANLGNQHCLGRKLPNESILLRSQTRVRNNQIKLCDNGFIMSPETCSKISNSLTGKVQSPETRLKMSNAAKGRIVSPETRQKLREATTGHTKSPETLLKLSNAAKGRISANRKAVKDSNGNTFVSFLEAGKFYNVSGSAISVSLIRQKTLRNGVSFALVKKVD